jgi:hypothetical protein
MTQGAETSDSRFELSDDERLVFEDGAELAGKTVVSFADGQFVKTFYEDVLDLPYRNDDTGAGLGGRRELVKNVFSVCGCWETYRL